MTWPPHSESMTIIQTPHLRLAKKIEADGTIIDYDKVRTINASQVRVSGLSDVYSLLTWLLSRPDRAIIRGELINGTAAKNIRRLATRDKKTGDEPTFRDVARRFLFVDCDGVELPAGTHVHDLLGCADAVIETLPKPFHRAACVVQASAGHGIKPGIRIRLIFHCDRPMGGAELARWLPNTDTSVYRPVQVIYTAAPVFAQGRADHLPCRLAEYPGEDWLHCPTAEELAPPPLKLVVQPQNVATGVAADAYTRAALTKAADAILNAGIGKRHETIFMEARSLARLVRARLLVADDMRRVLTRAAQCAGKDDVDEIESCIDWGLENPSNGVLPEARHAA